MKTTENGGVLAKARANTIMLNYFTGKALKWTIMLPQEGTDVNKEKVQVWHTDLSLLPKISHPLNNISKNIL